MSMTPDKAKESAIGILNLISGPLASSIFTTHPNDLGAMQEESANEPCVKPPEWHGWWQWSGESDDSWRALVGMANSINIYNNSGGASGAQEDADIRRLVEGGLPENIARLLFDARTLSLPRQLNPIRTLRSGSPEIPSVGMSPKKYHEVSQMVTYLLDLLDDLREQYGTEVRHIIDIGAGQGHLSRSLCKSELMQTETRNVEQVQGNNRDLRVLALDSFQQREGSSRKYERSGTKGTLTQRTCWLGEMPAFENHPGLQGSNSQESTSLKRVVDEWIDSFGAENDADIDTRAQRPVPVVFVALHACGSLTPFIMREALDNRRSRSATRHTWYVAAAVVVGCCYNLMNKADFPLSRIVQQHLGESLPTFELTPSHLQLAAQVPSEWFRSKELTDETELAVKKILYRALLTPLLAQYGDNTVQKLGKLNRRAYENFETYLKWVGDKLGKDLPAVFKESYPGAFEASPLARRIRALHALRCLLGPPVESLITLDRLLWLHEKYQDNKDLNVELINLFDQATGSGRNVAVVLAPSRPSITSIS